MLVAGAVSFCLFTLMSLLVASNDPTQLAPQASIIRIENIQLPEEISPSRDAVVDVPPRAAFIAEIEEPSKSELNFLPLYFISLKAPFEQIKPTSPFEKIELVLSPIIDRDATLLAVSSPQYPQRAAQKNIQGHIVVAMNVDQTGSVYDAWVVEALPAGYFEEQALRAAKKFKYSPRIENGKTVMASNLQYRWDFNLP